MSYPNRWRADMTLGEAIERRRYSIACACIGPPHPSPPGTPCGCALTTGQGIALHRGAHIVAKLLAELHLRRGIAGVFEVPDAELAGRHPDVPGAAHAEQLGWLSEFREALAESWPCKACALPEYAHLDDVLPDWVRPHNYDPADRPTKATAVITTVVPPEGS